MEALNKIKMKPDIILLDINMPRMDGIEVCRLIRSKVLCPILFLTARVHEERKHNISFFSIPAQFPLNAFFLRFSYGWD